MSARIVAVFLSLAFFATYASADMISELEDLRAEKKFVEFAMYPGAPSEAIRLRCETALNSLISRLIASPEQLSDRDYVLSEIGKTLTSLESEDSEEQDRALLYMEKILAAVGIESSDGLLNTWRYGFEPRST